MRRILIIATALGAACGFVPAPLQNTAQLNTRQTFLQTQPPQKSTHPPPALKATQPDTTPSAKHSYPTDWQSQILSALSVIIDPDLETDIVTLGFVQNLSIDPSTNIISLDLELTTPACPVKDIFIQQCQDIINNIQWTSGCKVTLTSRPNVAPSGSPLGMSQIGAVIAVSSCKGGVGKSTTAVNLAFALQSQGASVGIFDADVYGPSLPTMVTPEDDTVRFIGRQIAPLKRGNVSLMSFGYVNEGSAVMRGPMVTQLLDQFLSLTHWGPLDYLILDMPPGTGDIQLTLSQKLNITAAVIVTTPQELSFVDVERGVEMFDTVGVPCVAVVENMAYFENQVGGNTAALKDVDGLKAKFMEALEADGLLVDGAKAGDVAEELIKIVLQQQEKNIAETTTEKIRIFGQGHKRRLSEQWGIEHTYSVPLLGRIAENGDSGTPFIVDNPTSPQADIYRELAQSVVSEVAKFKFGKNKYSRPSVSYDDDNRVIRVFDNDEESVISPADLRRGCRCAACVEEMTGRQILDPASISESVKPLEMSPTGNYALSVDWSDGHRSLYPYRQVRAMIEEKQAGKEGAKEMVQA
ncbi:hypothetical protein ACHAWO_010796 [Cyclotella atomus]|uniref:MIP18 family-like domain-containing protein n=1 Tax=Cyclotella atomus TaxID=382360 RepID=A0ABD3NC10_9STRA